MASEWRQGEDYQFALAVNFSPRKQANEVPDIDPRAMPSTAVELEWSTDASPMLKLHFGQAYEFSGPCDAYDIELVEMPGVPHFDVEINLDTDRFNMHNEGSQVVLQFRDKTVKLGHGIFWHEDFVRAGLQNLEGNSVTMHSHYVEPSGSKARQQKIQRLQHKQSSQSKMVAGLAAAVPSGSAGVFGGLALAGFWGASGVASAGTLAIAGGATAAALAAFGLPKEIEIYNERNERINMLQLQEVCANPLSALLDLLTERAENLKVRPSVKSRW